MSVNPGFGGQQFMNSSLGKIKYLKRIKEERTLKYTIAVDGGINTENAPELIASGVETLIAGTTIFRSKNRALTIQRLRGNKEKA
jgi:ribulose-phosphate 3-epimerase